MHRVGDMLPQDQGSDLSMPPSYPRTLACPLAGQACQGWSGCPVPPCRRMRSAPAKARSKLSGAPFSFPQMCRRAAAALRAWQIWMTQWAHIQEVEAHASHISNATATAFVTPFMHSCITLTGPKLITCSSRAVVDPSAHLLAATGIRCVSAPGQSPQSHRPPRPGEPLFHLLAA
jgi:hypothetical protein